MVRKKDQLMKYSLHNLLWSYLLLIWCNIELLFTKLYPRSPIWVIFRLFVLTSLKDILNAPHVNLPKHYFVMNFSNKSFPCCLLTLYNINIRSITTIFFLTYATTKISRISFIFKEAFNVPQFKAKKSGAPKL